MGRRRKVFNVITKLAVGGAQETALSYCVQLDEERWQATLVTGPDRSPEGDLFDAAERLGVPVITLPELHRAINPLLDLRAVVELVRLFRRERPDVVHTHSSKAGLVGRLAARIARVPVVVHTVHGWSFHEGMSPVARVAAQGIERLAVRWSSSIVVVAESDARAGLAAGIGRPSQYALVRSAIDVAQLRREAVSRASARAALGIADSVPLVGTVTRLCRQKDPQTLLRAARMLADAVPGARLVVIGDGPLRAEVERMLDELDLRSVVLLLGRRSDVGALMPAFDVFVLASRWEGLPRVVVEAMAAGVPVVSTDVGGVSEAVHDELSGLLTPAGDPEALAGALARVLREPGLADRLRAGAASRVDEFDVSRMVDRLDDLYSRLVPAGRSRPRRRRMAAAVRTDSGHEAA